MRNEDDRRFAQTLARGLHVLRAFKASDGPLGNQELAARTNIPKPTISRLTFTLTELGFLERLRSFDKYRLGPAAIALGSVAQATIPFIESAGELMQPLADDVEALVALTMRDGNRMLLTHCWRPQNTSSIWINTGFRMPLVGTSTGLAYLASMEPAKLKPLLDKLGKDTTLDCQGLPSEIEQSKNDLVSKGFVESLGRWNPNVFGVSVPFRTSLFADPLVFLCGAPSQSVSKKNIENVVGPKLAYCVRQLDNLVSGGMEIS